MLELAIFTPSSAHAALQSSANRIELCADYSLGGVTPSLSTLQEILSQMSSSNNSTIPITVMIRPRGGDFYYSAEEYAEMERDILAFKELASGFVFGILEPLDREEGWKIDMERNKKLVQLASPLPCTFHRAIDEVSGNLEDAVEKAIQCGFRRVLSSGCKGGGALQGAEALRRVQERFGDRIEMIAGGGIRSGNVEEVVGKTGVKWVHSAAIAQAGNEEVDVGEVRGMIEVLARIKHGES